MIFGLGSQINLGSWGLKSVFLLLRGIRLLFAMMGFGMLAYAAVGAAIEREERQALPKRIGEVVVETTYLEDVQRHATNMWIDIYIALAPGLMPPEIVAERQKKSSLDALKTRTRFTAQGLDPDGSPRGPRY